VKEDWKLGIRIFLEICKRRKKITEKINDFDRIDDNSELDDEGRLERKVLMEKLRDINLKQESL